ncbi:hypothetical protein WICPIJ_008196 [Wickerhamomyces pijperi]|uniref:S-adenosylmethionine decarboxylase proenzyme n=1 Tax=Wickerhamomyces pijperi TaxID=599730 RepID=A0A9P8PZY9_WICPI|nr:hypothetical protein WICPIJ_008196 [Wickerhamomyces pijperi]
MTPIEFNPSDNSYVDHELSVNLDSTEAFEGPEKLLEIWFYPNLEDVPAGSKTLRSISFDLWSQILDLVNCKILSIKSSKYMHAFLLSESSLFVYDHKLVLKTCGTTTTLYSLNAIFQLVKKELNWEFVLGGAQQPYKVFYSRRAFMFPDKQKSIHKNWSSEVEYLNEFFTNGSQYLIGRIDNSQWHLYITDSNKEEPVVDYDETFEVLMTGIPADKARDFVTSRKPGFEIDGNQDLGHFLGISTSNNTGLNNIYEGDIQDTIIHDAFSFTPCGYSSNTILDDKYYYTLHVTPEKGWSYASFESNVNTKRFNTNNIEILTKVLKIFNPDKFQLTLFKNLNYTESELFSLTSLNGYNKIDRIVYDLGHYQLLYLSFEKDPNTLINGLSIA